MSVSEPKHPDFEKIYSQFQKRYCTGDSEDASPEGGPCSRGKSLYHAWLNKMGLDDTKPYSNEDQFSESFGWARTLITRLKEEDGRRLYKVDACFPLSSMNRNVYTEDELIQATRMLRLVKSNLNHTDLELPFTNEGAQYEDGAAEILMSTSVDAVSPMGHKYVDMLECSPNVPEDLHIVHVSIEGDCIGSEETDEGSACVGLGYTGIAYLTKKVLPGIPLTRIVPVERIIESFSPEGEVMEKPELPEEDKTVEDAGPRSDADRAKAHFGISDEEWDKLSDEEKQAYIDKLPPRGSGGDSEEQAEPERDLAAEVDAVNKRIDDLIDSLQSEDTPEEQDAPDSESEPVCGDCAHYIDGKCEEDDIERDAGIECNNGSFTPKGEPTSEPEKQDAEEPTEVEGEEEEAPEEVKEAVESPTKFDYVKRYNELKEQGRSARDAWRLAGFEMIEHLQRA